MSFRYLQIIGLNCLQNVILDWIEYLYKYFQLCGY